MDVLLKKVINADSKELVVEPSLVLDESLYDSLHTYLQAATADNTRKAYRKDIFHFIAWGGVLPTTSETIIHYLNHYAPLLNSRTLIRRLTALKHWHLYQGFLDPTAHALVRKTLKGIQNIHGKPKVKVPALALSDLITMVSFVKQHNKIINIRNSALLQIGFFGAFRRSELVSLHYHQIRFVNEGVEIELSRSKTDQRGEGKVCAIPYGNDILCAVTALKHWLNILPIPNGPVFKRISKSGKISEQPIAANHINLIIKKLAQDCLLPNSNAYSGHSLRRGFATAASQQGVSLSAIMQQGRWVNPATALGYMEEANRFKGNAAGTLLNNIEK